MKNKNCIDTMPASMTPTIFGPPLRAGRVLHPLHRWIERGKQRRQLAQLNDTALKDMGLTRADVRRECEKMLWQP